MVNLHVGHAELHPPSGLKHLSQMSAGQGSSLRWTVDEDGRETIDRECGDPASSTEAERRPSQAFPLEIRPNTKIGKCFVLAGSAVIKRVESAELVADRLHRLIQTVHAAPPHCAHTYLYKWGTLRVGSPKQMRGKQRQSAVPWDGWLQVSQQGAGTFVSDLQGAPLVSGCQGVMVSVPCSGSPGPLPTGDPPSRVSPDL
jgi:hypothetical protein